ncbi:MAG TPA: TIGR02611 family protein [Jiangellales bacterium]|nr:TIGR02611 family protein [Jiangellales bacterium]
MAAAQTPPDADEHVRFRRYHAWRRTLAANPALDLTWRLGVLVVGSAVVLAGLAMLVLPGPGWAAIFVGLAILGTEFHWARRLLLWVRARARTVARRAMDPQRRRRNQVLAAVALVLAVAAVAAYVALWGPPDVVMDLVKR